MNNTLPLPFAQQGRSVIAMDMTGGIRLMHSWGKKSERQIAA